MNVHQKVEYALLVLILSYQAAILGTVGDDTVNLAIAGIGAIVALVVALYAGWDLHSQYKHLTTERETA